MATYKLIQNIEAEDKILGPLTLRQFIFALVAAFFGYLCFICIAKQVYFLLIIFAPPGLLMGFFAFPFGGDQPTEIWALAKLRFYFKPRKRIWDQSGAKEMVTITVPKKIERSFTDGLSETEVQSRLKALASTIDSRGWAIKNVNIDNYSPNPLATASTDRLLDIASVPNTVPETIIQASDDILDENNNPIAQQFDSMIAQSTQRYRQELAHRGRPGIGRERQAAECAHCCQCAEHDAARGRRLEMVGKPSAPIHHKIDVKSDADAKQERQGDDIGVI